MMIQRHCPKALNQTEFLIPGQDGNYQVLEGLVNAQWFQAIH
jgi:hypothetical protein